MLETADQINDQDETKRAEKGKRTGKDRGKFYL